MGRPKGGTGPAAGTGSGRSTGGWTPRRTKRSHSLSQTRRPIAASSTERVAPLRCTDACSAQIAAHFTVAYTCHQWTHSGATGDTARRLVGGEQIGDGAEAADLAGAAEAPGRRTQPADVLGRVASVGELPIEHAAQAVGPDEQVAHAEVAVHRDRGTRLGTVRSQPAHAELERGTDLAQGIEEGKRVAQGIRRREAVDRGGVDGVDGGERAGRTGPSSAARASS